MVCSKFIKVIANLRSAKRVKLFAPCNASYIWMAHQLILAVR